MPLVPKSDTLIITSFPPSWDALADITCATHKAYADRWGFDYHADRSDLTDNYWDPVLKRLERLPIKGFIKCDLLLKYLPLYKRVVWLDADSLVTNKNINLDLFDAGLITMPYDWNGHNATTIIVRSRPETFAFWWACNNTGRKLFLKHDWVEMEASRYFSQTEPYRHIITHLSIKDLCAILPEEYQPYVPLSVMEPYRWQRGDFILHLSALTLQRRIELARKYSTECE